MPITGSTRVLMILGDPVVQVRAPELFNPLFAAHGVDAVVVPVHVSPAALPGFVRHVVTAGNIDGLLLTIPHKAPVFELLDRCDTRGTVARSVNALRRGADGALEGALFDGLGFVKALDHFGLPIAGSRVLVVGAGGAGAAIAAALAERGVGELALFDLDRRLAEALAHRVHAAWLVPVRAAASADPAAFDIVVNATPLGLRPDDPLPFDVARLDAGAAVVDILMKAKPTPLLRACAARGVRAFPGLEMMIQQAPEYLDFFGLPALAQALRDDSSAVRARLTPPATS